MAEKEKKAKPKGLVEHLQGQIDDLAKRVEKLEGKKPASTPPKEKEGEKAKEEEKSKSTTK